MPLPAFRPVPFSSFHIRIEPAPARPHPAGLRNDTITPNGKFMDCRYLHHFTSGTWKVTSCAARHQLYLPSLAELEARCQNGGHEHCPLFHTPFAREIEPTLISCRSYPFQEIR